ncbi:MAG: 50S ribosomal protein L1, partial [Methanoregula sp.]|nr:50S ribosomal protein L1 [Methanoregula sp.]
IGICVIGKGDIVTQAKDAKVDLIIGPEEVERLGGAPREARRVASTYRYFLAEMGVMPQVGRYLGPRLGPRGRMPMPIAGGQDIRPIVERLRNSVKIRTKDKTVFSTKVGSTAMKPEQVAENIEAIVKRIEAVLDQGPLNVRSVFVKTTMGPAVRLE